MAATTNRPMYVGAAQLACGIASLASGSSRESATQASPSTTGDFDFLVSLTFTMLSGAPSTTGPCVNIYAVGSTDATLWPIIQLSSGAPKATGAGDASVGAIGVVANMSLIGSFGLQTTTTNAERTFRTRPYSVAAGFNGVVPPAFSIVVENQTGLAFSTSTTTTANYLQINGYYTSSGN